LKTGIQIDENLTWGYWCFKTSRTTFYENWKVMHFFIQQWGRRHTDAFRTFCPSECWHF